MTQEHTEAARIPTREEVAANPNILFDRAPAMTISAKPVEVTVVAKRCVYINDHRVAGGKPYYSENLPSHDLKTSLGDVLSAFKAEDVRAALTEREARAAYFAAYHAQPKEPAA